MPHIKELKSQEMEEIISFYHQIQEYGHIFYGTEEELSPAFNKIMEGIEEVQKIMKHYYEY